MNPSPPKYILKFLRWFCHPDLIEDVEGDLTEFFHKNVGKRGLTKAKRRFFLDVALLFRPGIIRPIHIIPPLTSSGMFKNYIKIVWRNLIRQKAFSIISILGLAIGMMALLFISSHVKFEQSYDQFHTKVDNIYRMRAEGKYKDGSEWFTSTNNFPFAGPSVTEKIPEILDFCRLYYHDAIITNPDNNEKFKETEMLFADSSFLWLFDFPLLAGNPRTALTQPNSVVITRDIAQKYFGSTDAMGEQLVMDNDDVLTVTGVLDDIPENSHLDFEWLISYYTVTSRNFHESEGWTAFPTYLHLTPNPDIEKLHQEFDDILYEKKGDYFDQVEAREYWRLQPLKDIHLYSGFRNPAGLDAEAKIVWLLLLIAIFVMVLAWINYVNLSTARAIERSKEVGIRKTTGATQRQIMVQFLIETFLINGLAMIVAVISVEILSPYFASLTGRETELSLLTENWFWITAIKLWFIGSILSGFYPAFVMSSFQPIQVLKGKHVAKGSFSTLRKGLVVFQFAMAIGLIIGTTAIYKQIQFMRNQNLGFHLEQTYVLNGTQMMRRDTTFTSKFLAFKSDILKNPRIIKMTSSESVPGHGVSTWGGYIRRAEFDRSHAKSYSLMAMDYDFLDTYGLEVIAGRSFSKEISSDNQAIMINETALKELGFSSPEEALNQQVIYPINGRQDGSTANIIGVIKDYHQYSLRQPYRQIIYQLADASPYYFSMRLSTNDLEESLAHIENTWQTHFPNDPYDSFFLDDYYNSHYDFRPSIWADLYYVCGACHLHCLARLIWSNLLYDGQTH